MVPPSSLLLLLLEFLLLWLVRDWLSLLSLVREAHPLLSSGRDSQSQEFVARRSWWRFVRRALPALFKFIAYLTGLNSNPFGSSDLRVAARPSGSLAGGLGGRVVTVVAGFPAWSGVSCRRVLLLLLGTRAVSVVAIFTRAAVGFVLGLRIRVVVSQRLREPTCGVAFTGAGLWSVEPALCSAQSASLLELRRCLYAVLHHWLSAATPEEASCVPSSSAFRGCSGWWCSAMAVGAVFCTVATFMVKISPLELS
ncbi:hypothetical protein Taro_050339 [Colocasia esculenta]|uniref:Uncharacterized protein n=1 Tax=Colocasia esculenta TaxID=4460 RepID=A0A843XD54_COLES|nr:hypothetical protein [Colocasia esculenta]